LRQQTVVSGWLGQIGAGVAIDITEEFRHRPWHKSVKCEQDRVRLVLQADNDFDSDGLALRDEFSDAISACAREHLDGNIEITSVKLLERPEGWSFPSPVKRSSRQLEIWQFPHE
jgi:hypothetical protein